MTKIKLDGVPECNYIVYAFTDIDGDQEDFDKGYADRRIVDMTDSLEEAKSICATINADENDIRIGTLIDGEFNLLTVSELNR